LKTSLAGNSHRRPGILPDELPLPATLQPERCRYIWGDCAAF